MRDVLEGSAEIFEVHRLEVGDWRLETSSGERSALGQHRGKERQDYTMIFEL